MLAEYLPLVLLAALAVAFVGLSLLVSARLGPHDPNPVKQAPYESGIIPDPATDIRGTRFAVRFYLIAMLFIIFDVEVVFFYPFAVMFRELGLWGLGMMGIFIAMLAVAFLYEWRMGGFDWEEEERSPREIASHMLMQRATERAEVRERLGA